MLLLPYDAINHRLPWDHPDNAPHFKRPNNTFLHPAIPDVVDDQGYVLSHYAANNRVMSENSAMPPKEVRDGTSHTILIGEVNANFKPWGHPVNSRDAALGLASPDGFGGPARYRVTLFLMMDGSVHTLSNDTDPGILKGLSTPAGGEPLPQDW